MDKLLDEWDQSLNHRQHARLDDLLNRREFLTRAIKTVGTVAFLPVSTLLPACSEDRTATQQQLIGYEPWQTFAAVQQLLFPDDGNGPDAMAINATLYLKFVLDASDTADEERDFIFQGIGWLNDLARQQHTHEFLACTAAQQAALLQTIVTSRSGERWISYLLTYLIEALLSDPVYGGNPAGIGWQWLEHIPGFPRPPQTKTYPYLLGKRR